VKLEVTRSEGVSRRSPCEACRYLRRRGPRGGRTKSPRGARLSHPSRGSGGSTGGPGRSWRALAKSRRCSPRRGPRRSRRASSTGAQRGPERRGQRRGRAASPAGAQRGSRCTMCDGAGEAAREELREVCGGEVGRGVTEEVHEELGNVKCGEVHEHPRRGPASGEVGDGKRNEEAEGGVREELDGGPRRRGPTRARGLTGARGERARSLSRYTAPRSRRKPRGEPKMSSTRSAARSPSE